MQNKINSILTKLIKEELNKSFINENKLYTSNIIFNLTKKLGDNSDDTLNKLSIFGLFRQAAPFNAVKDINQLQSLDQLNELFNKWKESALTQLVSTDGPLKGNKTAALTYLDVYIKNIKSLGNNAKPFSYRDAEKTLIDVANNNGWVKSNDNSVSTYGIDSPNKQDILFEDNTVLIVKSPSKAKCIMYGQGKSWCISQTGLNMYNTYRIKHGATIYFVLNKTKSKVDVERTCVILRYSGEKYGIADATNTGDRSGGPEVAVDGFDEVESELPWLRGKGQYFTESEVTQSEEDYGKVSETRYDGNDLGNYIINTAKGLKFNGEDVDPVDFLREYLTNNSLSDEQFISLSELMKVQVIEMGKSLSNDVIKTLSSNLKVRYAVLQIKKQATINFDIYSEEEKNRVLENTKGLLDNYDVRMFIRSVPIENRYTLGIKLIDYVKEISIGETIGDIVTLLSDVDKDNFVNEVIDKIPLGYLYRSYYNLLQNTDIGYRYNLILKIISKIQGNVRSFMCATFLEMVPKSERVKLCEYLLKLADYSQYDNIVGNLLQNIEIVDRYALILKIIKVSQGSMSGENYDSILQYTPNDKKQEVRILFDKYNQPVNESWLRKELNLVLENYRKLNESDVPLLIEEAVYKGRKVPLRKIMRGDVKKFKVYVKSGDRVLKINFGHGGSSAKAKSEKTMEIKRDNLERRKAFRSRFNCDTAKDETTPRYWSCKTWSNKKVSDLLKEIISEEIETYLN